MYFMAEGVVETLEQIGKLMLLIREIPAPFIDGFFIGSSIDHLVMQPEHDYDGETGGGQTRHYSYHSGSQIVVKPENYTFRAILLRKNNPERWSMENPLNFSLYFFFRQEMGATGEYLVKADCKSIAGRNGIVETYDWGHQNGEILLTIGRNEHYNPEIGDELGAKKKRTLGAIIVGEEKSRMHIIPSLPQDDADQILGRLKRVVVAYKGIPDYKLKQSGISPEELREIRKQQSSMHF